VNAATAAADSRRALQAAVRDALAGWVSLPQGGDRRLTEAWHAQLRHGGMLWAACGEHVPHLLSERLACVVSLAKRWDMAPAPQPPPLLRQWLECARCIGEHWPPTDAAGWHALLADLPGRGNPLLDAVIAHSLVAAWQQAGVPQALTRPLSPLLQPALAWSKTVPLPPAAKCSLQPAEYLLLHLAATECTAVDRDATGLVQQLEAARVNIAKAIPKSGDRRVVDMLAETTQDIQAARRNWGDVLTAGGNGWPTEHSVLQERAATFFQALDRLQRVAHPLAARVKTDIGGLAVLLRQRWDRLLAELLMQAAVASPGDDRATAETLTSGDGEPPWPERVAAVARQVGMAPDPAAEKFAARLLEIAAWEEAAQGREADSSSDALRQLVGCLVSLDQRASQSSPPPWLGQVRADLRALLAAEGTYRVIDAELIAGDLARYEAEAEAVGWVDSKTVKSGYIAAVVLPGYAIRDPHGGWRVLQKAKVSLAR
jgi:hypothetical protein